MSWIRSFPPTLSMTRASFASSWSKQGRRERGAKRRNGTQARSVLEQARQKNRQGACSRHCCRHCSRHCSMYCSTLGEPSLTAGVRPALFVKFTNWSIWSKRLMGCSGHKQGEGGRGVRGCEAEGLLGPARARMACSGHTRTGGVRERGGGGAGSGRDSVRARQPPRRAAKAGCTHANHGGRELGARLVNKAVTGHPGQGSHTARNAHYRRPAHSGTCAFSQSATWLLTFNNLATCSQLLGYSLSATWLLAVSYLATHSQLCGVE